MQTIGNLLFWGLLFFLMMRFGCGAHMMGHHHHRDHSRGGDRDGHRAPPEARDPVCGKTVQPSTAKSSLFEGHAYYFCSQACRDTFEASPANFAHGAAANDRTGGHYGAA
jgi:YHS domain-containing protein